MNLTVPAFTRPAGRIVATARNPVFLQLLAAHAPAIPRTLAQLAALEQAAKAIPEPDPGRDADTVRAALEDGTIGDLDLVEVFRRGSTDDAAYMRTSDQLHRIAAGLHSEIDSEIDRAAKPMAADIARRVERIVDQLRQHPIATAGIDTAEAAIAAELVDEWAAHGRLRSDYATAFGALDLLVRTGTLGDAGPWHRTGIEVRRCANIEDVAPEYLAIIAGEVGQHRASWPTDPDAFLTWLVRTPDAAPAALTPDEVGPRTKTLRAAVTAWRNREEDERRQRAADNPNTAARAHALTARGRRA